MDGKEIIWISSFPRSGNTLLRTILWQCFGLKSASIYTDDFGGNALLEEYVGHIEQNQNATTLFQEGGLPLLKTHEFPRDGHPAIYITRDGRAACASLFQFTKGALSLDQIIKGETVFGSWTEHIQSWSPWSRKRTLWLQYEQMLDDLDATLGQIESFLQRPIVSNVLPSRESISGVDGKWVRKHGDWRDVLSLSDQRLFNVHHCSMMKELGYLE